jgi:hypothetical protein
VSKPSPLWNIVIKIAVEVAEETEARAIADLLLGRMEVAPTEALVFVHFDDGTWATELRVDDPGSEQVEPSEPAVLCGWPWLRDSPARRADVTAARGRRTSPTCVGYEA